jgi:hypothetical protein
MLSRQAAATALQYKEWLDKGQLTEVAATEMPISDHVAPALVAVLLLGGLVVGFGLLSWRYLLRRWLGPDRAPPGFTR